MSTFTNAVNLESQGTVYVSTTGVWSGLDGSTSGFVLTSNGTGVAPSFQASSASGAIVKFTPNSGTNPIVPDGSGNVNLSGSGSTTVVGGLNTATFELTGLTNHAVLVGAGTTTITKVGPTATTGQVLQNNAGADPTYSTATYPSTTTINQILYSSANNVVGGLTTGNNGILITGTTGIPSVLTNGTTGQVLTATTGSPPSWASAASSGIVTINGDSGSITGSTVTIYAHNSTLNCGATVKFANSGTTSTFNVTDVNGNTIIGSGAGNATFSGGSNTIIGQIAGTSLTTGAGSQNAALGVACLASLTTGANNTALGYDSLANINTGGSNIAIGALAGNSYASSESGNIVIGSTGTAAESHVIRIGTQGSGGGQQNLCFIAGISGTTPTSVNIPQVVLCDDVGGLGTISSGTAGFVLTSNGMATPSFQAIPTSALSWIPASSTPITAAVNTGYYITDASQVTITLPTTAAAGSIVAIVGNGAGGWILQPGAGQTIKVINVSAGTSITSGEQYDCIEVLCSVANTTWIARSFTTSGFTYV